VASEKGGPERKRPWPPLESEVSGIVSEVRN